MKLLPGARPYPEHFIRFISFNLHPVETSGTGMIFFFFSVWRTEARLKLKEASMDSGHLAPESMVIPSELSWPFQRQRLTSSQCGGRKSFWPDAEQPPWVSVFLWSLRQLWWEAAAAFCARPRPSVVPVYLDPLISSGFVMHGKCFLMGLGLWEQQKPHLHPPNPEGHSDTVKLSECPLDWTVPKLVYRVCPQWACVPCRTYRHHSKVTLTRERIGGIKRKRKQEKC